MPKDGQLSEENPPRSEPSRETPDWRLVALRADAYRQQRIRAIDEIADFQVETAHLRAAIGKLENELKTQTRALSELYAERDGLRARIAELEILVATDATDETTSVVQAAPKIIEPES